MADTDTSLATTASASAAPSEAAPSSPSSGSIPSEGAGASVSSDSRAIAEALIKGSKGETVAVPPTADPSAEPPPVEATPDGPEDADPNLLAPGSSIPLDRHKAVLTNTRNRVRAEVEAEYQGKYGWVDQLGADQHRVANALGLMQALDGPHAERTLRTLASALGVQLTPPPPPPEPEAAPAPDVKLADGSEFYSAPQLSKLMAWQQKQFEARLEHVTKRYDPLVQRQVEVELRQQSQAEATSLLATCRREWPQFGELETDIKARMLSNPSLNLERAYIQAFAAKGLPALKQQHETDRASQLQRKAAASAPPPSAPRAVTPLRDRDRTTRDIVAEELARAASA